MDEKMARKYRDSDGFPVWPEVLARLEAEPKLRSFALFGWLQE